MVIAALALVHPFLSQVLRLHIYNCLKASRLASHFIAQGSKVALPVSCAKQDLA